MTDLRSRALRLLRVALEIPQADFHDDQLEAIELLVNGRERLLLVQRTGWGKSIVYFIATSLLRSAGSGPTVIISPLLALMRNQLEAARRLNLRAERIDSSNRHDDGEWDRIFDAIERDEVDLLLISPERLGNPQFQAKAGAKLFGRLGMLVIDEAHCISDWGHDFRPHYRRIADIVRFLPPNVAMLATTATADDPVIADVRHQLGDNVRVIRGPLGRDSLHLDTLSGLSYTERLAWLAAAIPKLSGSGIVYALTKDDADIVANWLVTHNITAAAYHSAVGDEIRQRRERALLDDDLNVLVATSALGMGFDKPNIGFVIHFQSTQSIVNYYQQVGRAGRAVERADAILLGGTEDDDIFEYFVKNALPSEEIVNEVLRALDDSADGLSVKSLTSILNVSQTRLQSAIDFLSLETPSPVAKLQNRWARTAVPFEYPVEKARALAERRRADRAAMIDYARADSCLMQRLSRSLGDEHAKVCERCFACTGKHVVDVGDTEPLLVAAEDFLRRNVIRLPPRKMWPEGGLPLFGFGSNKRIKPELQAEEGRALVLYKVGSVGRRIPSEKYTRQRFSQDTVRESAEMIRAWLAQTPPAWIVPMISERHPELITDFARQLALDLDIPCFEALRKTRSTEQQKGMENGSFRAKNLDGSLEVVPFEGMVQAGLFVDDLYDSGLTATVAVALLRQAGAGPVYPFALVRASGKE